MHFFLREFFLSLNPLQEILVLWTNPLTVKPPNQAVVPEGVYPIWERNIAYTCMPNVAMTPMQSEWEIKEGH